MRSSAGVVDSPGKAQRQPIEEGRKPYRLREDSSATLE
jgi:hypothetical protein